MVKKYSQKNFVSYGNGTWVVGKKWIVSTSNFNISTEQDCLSLNMCVINKQLVNGSECENSYVCEGNTYSCLNGIFLFLFLFLKIITYN